MAYTSAADGITKQGKTKGRNLGDDGAKVGIQTGAKSVKKTNGGKTNEQMLQHGRNRSKLVNQFGSIKLKGAGK